MRHVWFEAIKLGCKMYNAGEGIDYAARGCISVEEVVVLTRNTQQGGTKQELWWTSRTGK